MRTGACLIALLLASTATAQTPGTAYHRAPDAIAKALETPPTPAVGVSPDHRTLAIFGRENLPTIANLSKPILRLGGYRIDPATNGQAEVRVQWLNALSFKDIASGRTIAVQLPAGLRFAAPDWSPDGGRVAFYAQDADGLSLWVSERDGRARVVAHGLNGAFGTPFVWMPDSRSLVAYTVPAGRGARPAQAATPTGPIVQESSGRTSAARTYEDLLGDAHDEALFDHYFTGQLVRIGLDDGATRPIGTPGLISGFSVSPDGRYLLTERLKRPYSYLLPARFFPTEIAVSTIDGQPVRTLVDRPLADDLPVDFDATVKGPREAEWRSDAPATLVWAEALDGGNPRTKIAFRDKVMMQAAPFDAAPVELARTSARYATTMWGDDGFAMIVDREWRSRTEHRLAVAPARPGKTRMLLTRNYQDQYGDPGDPILEENAAGKPVMRFTPAHDGVFVSGEGASKTGAFPFLATMPLTGETSTRLWAAKPPYYESVVAMLDDRGQRILTRRESATLAPNYVIRSTKGGSAKAITAFADPAPVFAGVTQRTITYSRADGVPLSGTLYLPAGYDAKRDGPLPTLLWAYPAEYTDAKVAGQTVDRGNRFVRPRGISHLFLLTQGYAILDNPAMPIIGEGGAEANDTYVKQLREDAQAAVDAVVKLGVADRTRIAVGGHSYGAFMTANLLAHTDLFRAGIARSGAYNRTLTPFGFQAEQRTYWQATPTYTEMSPFTYADRIKAPILLIHGGADDNSGTFPIQSERMYAALKGNGATVRYVVLPNEPHGYRALESTEETLWQMTDWLDRYVKPKQPVPTSPGTVSAR
ncbi:alpha/beta hydrolase family protein [Sphingomonas pseudosanguinis]|uniref:Dipeptidyl aminopeptidase/acylaminoacyl peptidase n=1 Tax=Sphingomonas pseudosanguinis TaxID=413712 RepID=A0A7W6A9N0_9SPHN|nr:prolyl oligopeptidase family serine peptidase [Sphingomonas pseudosanguinis]MBB3879752.1 dipeptidyl aminopeptidase/acylaminoacyl peptidase [Sphingomonas pseudosanguinis]MBN3536958.1 S9 family peptidase [Sphingomonas pseudosanguinis]